VVLLVHGSTKTIVQEMTGGILLKDTQKNETCHLLPLDHQQKIARLNQKKVFGKRIIMVIHLIIMKIASGNAYMTLNVTTIIIPQI
jgi:hypothetical protein